MDTTSITIPLAFFAGALSFVSPCVLPLVPVFLGYLSGSSVADEEDPNRWHVFSHALFFVGGFTLVFTVLFGLPASLLGSALNQYSDLIARVGGIVLIVFGIHTLGIVTIPHLNLTKRLEIKHGMAPSYARSTVIGVAFGAGWTPCIGPLLGAVMSMAFTNPSRGVLFVFTYALGLALPFLLSALLVTQGSDALRRLNRHGHWVQRVSGGFLVVIGLLLVSGKFAALNSVFINLTPEWMLEHM